jgi:hypothetical protein
MHLLLTLRLIVHLEEKHTVKSVGLLLQHLLLHGLLIEFLWPRIDKVLLEGHFVVTVVVKNLIVDFHAPISQDFLCHTSDFLGRGA